MYTLPSSDPNHLQVYGYLLNKEWLYNYGVDKGITYHPEDYEPQDAKGGIISATMSIMENQAGVPVTWATVPDKRDVAFCLTFASKIPQDARPMPSEDSLDCIKKILGMDKNPKWYHCHSISIAPQISYFHEVYGYLIDEDWLFKYGIDNGLLSDPSQIPKGTADIKGSVIPAVLALLKNQVEVPIGWIAVPYKDGLGMALCLTLASNDLSDPRPVPSGGDLDQIKKILNTDKNPKWHLRDG